MRILTAKNMLIIYRGALVGVLFMLVGLCSLLHAKSYYHTVQDADGRWWVEDPQGSMMVLVGVDHVTYIGHPCEKTGSRAYLETNKNRFADRGAWAVDALGKLRSWGFNALGCGCDEVLRGKGLPHVEYLDIGGQFSHLGGDSAIRTNVHNNPSAGFPNVFSPEWPKFCAKVGGLGNLRTTTLPAFTADEVGAIVG